MDNDILSLYFPWFVYPRLMSFMFFAARLAASLQALVSLVPQNTNSFFPSDFQGPEQRPDFTHLGGPD